jgi:hypothetical protein
MSAQALFAVPVVDVHSLECDTIAVAAACEAEAVFIALRHAANLRFTGGEIVRCEVPAEDAIVRDIWHERWRPARLREKV